MTMQLFSKILPRQANPIFEFTGCSWALINVITVVLRIDTSQTVAITRYQVALGLAGFERGSPPSFIASP